MNKAKKIILGVAIILAALAGAIIAVLDNDESPKLDTGATIEKVKEGVDVIKTAGDSDEAGAVSSEADASAPATGE
ncbi:MAG: hypothetical protein JXR97_16920 [Planctomycetes bacterium]|nr:hypothetical protein [Planctomycetota bacterium]